MTSNSFITLTPLAGQPLHFEAMTGTEELNRPFEYQVDILSKISGISESGHAPTRGRAGLPTQRSSFIPVGRDR